MFDVIPRLMDTDIGPLNGLGAPPPCAEAVLFSAGFTDRFEGFTVTCATAAEAPGVKAPCPDRQRDASHPHHSQAR